MNEDISLEIVTRTEYKPMRWIIDDILPRGVTLFGGDAKAGKSITSLHIALQYVKNNPDRYVIYYSLDDTNLRRMKERTLMLQSGIDVDRDRIRIVTDADTLNGIFVSQVRDKIDKYRNTDLVMIDVFANIKKAKGSDIFLSDYEGLVPLVQMSEELNIATLLLHHTRKNKDHSDAFSNFNGSTGQNAKVDTLWMLEDGPVDEKVYIRMKSRELLPMRKMLVSFELGDLETPWEIMGLDKVQRCKVRDILLHLCTFEPISPKRFASETGLNYDTVKSALRRLALDGFLVQTSNGAYRLPDPSQASFDPFEWKS